MPSSSSSGTSALTFDVGGSHVSAAVVRLDGRQVVRQVRLEADPSAPTSQLIATWASAGQQVWQAAGQPALHHLGLAIPGPFDYAAGISWMQHKFAALYGLQPGPLLQQALGLPELPIYVGNDAGLFALGEAWAGQGRSHRRLIGITLGTGLGAGFVANGQVLYGGNGVPHDGGLWDQPYLEGIAEDHASGRAILHSYHQLGGQANNVLQVSQAARQGDLAAQQAFALLGHHLAQILAPWIRDFGASLVVVGGSISGSFDLFEGSLRHSLDPLGVEVVASELLEEATLLGAAALGVVGG